MIATPANQMTTMLDPTKSNFQAWRANLFEVTENMYGVISKSLRSGEPPETTPFVEDPHKDDLNHDYSPPRLLYQREGENGYLNEPKQRNADLSNRGHQDLRDDLKEYRKSQRILAADDSTVLNIIKSSIVENSKTTVQASSDYEKFLALDPNSGLSSFTYFGMLRDTHMQGNLNTRLCRGREFFSQTQGDRPHEEFVISMREKHQTMLHDFGSIKHPGYIKLEDLTSCVYGEDSLIRVL